MRKKSQLRIGESIAVLLIFFVLIFIGLSFYMKVSESSSERFRRERFEMGAVDVAQRAISMPELRCSFENVPTNYCFDSLKIEFFKDYLDPNHLESKYSNYFNLFGKSNITIKDVLYEDDPLVIYEYHAQEETIIEKFPIRIPVSLYNPVNDEYNFGVLTVEAYRTI